MVKNAAAQESTQANGSTDKSPFLGNAPDHAMTFDFQDIADLHVPNVTSVPVQAQAQRK
ncbi:hypothetical protein KEM55_007506, partial [Ascosphaera atra]